MGAPIIVPRIHPLRSLTDPSVPPEASHPSPITRLERLALAQERTADEMARVADALTRAMKRMELDAGEFQEMVANGRTLSDRSAREVHDQDVLGKARVLAKC